FSSRRRHTRSKRDWSSDVCSSDLTGCLADQTVWTISAHDDICLPAACRSDIWPIADVSCHHLDTQLRRRTVSDRVSDLSDFPSSVKSSRGQLAQSLS